MGLTALDLLAVNTTTTMASSSPELTILGAVFVIALLFLFIVSGAQVAYFSLDEEDLTTVKTKSQPSYRRVVELLDSEQHFFSALQVAHFFFLFILIAVGNFIFNTLPLPIANIGILATIKVVAIFIIVFLFGELIPRLFAGQNSIRFARDFSFFSQGIFYLFGRLGTWVYKASFTLEASLFRRKNQAQFNLEMDEAIDKSSALGTDASDEEKNILKGIVKFSGISVKQIMTPRLEVSGIDFNTKFEDLINLINELHFSRLPVFKGSLDNTIGMIYTKDILPHLNEGKIFDWHSLIEPVPFVHEHKLIEPLLYEFQTNKTHLAMIVDEFGGTCGIVTLEDIQEEIIGEIKDEFAEEKSLFEKIDAQNYIFDGRVMLIDVCRIVRLASSSFDAYKGENDSIAGLVLELAKGFPEDGAVLEIPGFQFVVVQKSSNRLQKIKLTLLERKD